MQFRVLSLKCSALCFSLSLVLIGFALKPNEARAQDDNFLNDPQSLTRSQVPLVEPGDPVWEGSAQSVLLLEEGGGESRRRSPWSVSMFNWGNINMRNFGEGEGRLETYNYLSFNYRYTRELRFSVRPEFYLSGAGKDFSGRDAKGELELGNIYFQAFHNRLALIADTVGVKGGFRVYYPNTEHSKRQKTITRIQGRLLFEMPLGGGTWITHRMNPTYFVQSQKTYLTEFLNTRQTQEWEIENIFELSQFFGRSFGLHQNIRTEHRWYYSSSTNNLPAKTETYTGLGTWVSYNLYGLNLKGGLSYKTKLGTPESRRPIYNPEETAYSVMTYKNF